MSERIRIVVSQSRTDPEETGDRGEIVGFSGSTAICLMDDHGFRLYSLSELRADEPDERDPMRFDQQR